MTKLTVALAWLLSILAVDGRSAEVTTEPLPDWVNTHIFTSDPELDPTTCVGGFAFLLIDVQTHVPLESSFFHVAVKVLSHEGVQNMSDLVVEFDPAYQDLSFHHVRVHRKGQVIDKLSDHRIDTYQRETSLERHLYDGRITAVINLQDVRAGDIIEYAYTHHGFNPIHRNGYFEDFWMQAETPIQQIHVEIFVAAGDELHVLPRNGVSSPLRITRGPTTQYSWVKHDVPALHMDINVPVWYDPLFSVVVSQYDDWAEVVEWALPLYDLRPDDLAKLRRATSDLITGDNLDDRIRSAIRFVQEEIRYLGFENGLGAYLPNPPLTVLQRRYGDCKDKSLLLVAILRNLGIEAHVVLVDVLQRYLMEEPIPSPGAFNHCIVRFGHHGLTYNVDATAASQGGDLEHLHVPGYGRVLVVESGADALTDLPSPELARMHVTAVYKIEDFEGAAEFEVSTRYSSWLADEQRAMFHHVSHEEISRQCAQFYSEMYPGITATKPIHFNDDERDRTGDVVIEESYRIDSFWQESLEASGVDVAELYLLELRNIVESPASPARTMPYATGVPLECSFDIAIDMPEEWPVPPESISIRGGAFAYNSTVEGKGDRISLHHDYRRTAGHIMPGQVADHISKHTRIQNNLGFVIYNNRNFGDFRLSNAAMGLSLGTLVVCVYLALLIYRRFDPDPSASPDQALTIGGWLILPAIGFTLAPVNVLVSLTRDPWAFDHATWSAVTDRTGPFFDPTWAAMLAFSVVSVTFLMVAAILMLVLFYKRRTNFPRLVVGFYGVSLIITGLVMFASENLFAETFAEEDRLAIRRDFFQTVIATLIWVPYFNMSKRVKNTFVFKYRKQRPVSTEGLIRTEIG